MSFTYLSLNGWRDVGKLAQRSLRRGQEVTDSKFPKEKISTYASGDLVYVAWNNWRNPLEELESCISSVRA